jgi:hypothetical protein
VTRERRSQGLPRTLCQAASLHPTLAAARVLLPSRHSLACRAQRAGGALTPRLRIPCALPQETRRLADLLEGVLFPGPLDYQWWRQEPRRYASLQLETGSPLVFFDALTALAEHHHR